MNIVQMKWCCDSSL